MQGKYINHCCPSLLFFFFYLSGSFKVNNLPHDFHLVSIFSYCLLHLSSLFMSIWIAAAVSPQVAIDHVSLLKVANCISSNGTNYIC